MYETHSEPETISNHLNVHTPFKTLPHHINRDHFCNAGEMLLGTQDRLDVAVSNSIMSKTHRADKEKKRAEH